MEREKIEKYQDLKREMKRIWNMKDAKAIHIMIGAQGTVGKNLWNWIEKLRIVK